MTRRRESGGDEHSAVGPSTGVLKKFGDGIAEHRGVVVPGRLDTSVFPSYRPAECLAGGGVHGLGCARRSSIHALAIVSPMGVASRPAHSRDDAATGALAVLRLSGQRIFTRPETL